MDENQFSRYLLICLICSLILPSFVSSAPQYNSNSNSTVSQYNSVRGSTALGSLNNVNSSQFIGNIPTSTISSGLPFWYNHTSMCIPYTPSSSTVTGSLAFSNTVSFNNNVSFTAPISMNIGGASQVPSVAAFTGIADTIITNTDQETQALPSGIGNLTFPANYFTVGKQVILCGEGVYSTPAITSGTVTIRVKLNQTTIASRTTTALLTSADREPFNFCTTITFRTVGTNASFMVSGGASYRTGSGLVAMDSLDNQGNLVSGVDTTKQQTLNVTAQWDTASTSKIVKTTNANVRVLN